MKRKITFFEHRKIDSKNVIFRLIKIFKNFQNGLGNQFFWFLESSLGVDYKIPKVWLKVPKTWTKILSQKNWPKKSKKLEANSIQCSQAVTHPSTDWTQHCLTSVIGRELVYSMWYGRWHLKVANSHFFNLSHHYRKGRWNLKTGLKTQFSFSFCLLLHQGKSDWKTLNLSLSNANGHITLNTPVLVRSLKLSNVESSQYLDGWPPGNTGCCWLLFFVLFYSFLSTLLIHFWSIFDPFSPASTTCLKSQNVKKRFPCLTREGVGSQSCFQTLTFEENL